MFKNMTVSTSSKDILYRTVLISLGSNLPEKHTTPSLLIDDVVNSLSVYNHVINKVSRAWTSRAWPNENDPLYINVVISTLVTVEPRIILHHLQAVEKKFGRERSYKNAPRTLDLDIIAYDDLVITTDDLIVPHPRAHERAFVMGPLCDIEPKWRHPISGLEATALFKAARIGRDAYPLTEDVWPTL
jgi:2-amino-4-hydroxy-6-hydroxymethyldihydropteridine diphosphokinase